MARKKYNQGHCKSLNKDKVLLSTNCDLAGYLSDFTHKITKCYKQELTSCVITYPKFPSRICVKNVSKLFSVTSGNFGFILSVTTLIIPATGNFKTAANPGNA